MVAIVDDDDAAVLQVFAILHHSIVLLNALDGGAGFGVEVIGFEASGNDVAFAQSYFAVSTQVANIFGGGGGGYLAIVGTVGYRYHSLITSRVGHDTSHISILSVHRSIVYTVFDDSGCSVALHHVAHNATHVFHAVHGAIVFAVVNVDSVACTSHNASGILS